MSRTLGAIGFGALLGTLVPAGVARADHDMAAMSGHHHGDSEIEVGLEVEAAQFETMAYVGNHQGVMPSVSWMRGRLGASAALGLYRVTANGLAHYGPGDAMVTAHAVIIEDDAIHAGAALHVMAPTGAERDNLGMGHTMAMPSVWASWRGAPVGLGASLGYSRALVSIGGGGHDHGAAPLVDPMNLQELTWSASADVDVGAGVQLGGRARGAVPIGSGTTRVIGGGRVAWGTPRVTTGLEVQIGLAGDPFTIRGVVDTALRF
jgi:hypothetical protein